MATKPLPSPAELRQLLEYDPETGVLRWLSRGPERFDDPIRCRQWNTRFAGKAAGTLDKSTGYLCLRIFDRKVWAHRAAFALASGEWPEVIDHLNGNKSDNRFANLASGSQAQNMKNLRRYERNKSGATGVTWDKERGKWFASIKANGKTKSLGRFARFDDAVAARKAAEEEFGFSRRHGG